MEDKIQSRVCNRCGHSVTKVTESELCKEYPFYCPECDENLYGIETHFKEDSNGR